MEVLITPGLKSRAVLGYRSLRKSVFYKITILKKPCFLLSSLSYDKISFVSLNLPLKVKLFGEMKVLDDRFPSDVVNRKGDLLLEGRLNRKMVTR